jgi:cellulose 1,4-beta-cellobiosidase
LRSDKFVQGQANVLDWDAASGTGRYGSCCPELDLFDGNRNATALTAHSCGEAKSIVCEGKAECDKFCGGLWCQYNPYHEGHTTFYGPGLEVDTTKTISVVTQFITEDGTDDGALSEIRRYYWQDGKTIPNPGGPTSWSLNDKVCLGPTGAEAGKLKKLSEVLDRGMVLAMGIYDDANTDMAWLDSSEPVHNGRSLLEPQRPPAWKGPCFGRPEDARADDLNASATFSQIRYGPIHSTCESCQAPDFLTTHKTKEMTKEDKNESSITWAAAMTENESSTITNASHVQEKAASGLGQLEKLRDELRSKAEEPSIGNMQTIVDWIVEDLKRLHGEFEALGPKSQESRGLLKDIPRLKALIGELRLKSKEVQEGAADVPAARGILQTIVGNLKELHRRVDDLRPKPEEKASAQTAEEAKKSRKKTAKQFTPGTYHLSGENWFYDSLQGGARTRVSLHRTVHVHKLAFFTDGSLAGYVDPAPEEAHGNRWLLMDGKGQLSLKQAHDALLEARDALQAAAALEHGDTDQAKEPTEQGQSSSSTTARPPAPTDHPSAGAADIPAAAQAEAVYEAAAYEVTSRKTMPICAAGVMLGLGSIYVVRQIVARSKGADAPEESALLGDVDPRQLTQTVCPEDVDLDPEFNPAG